MQTSIANRLPTTRLPGDGDGLCHDDLYQKYCRFMEDARRQLQTEFPPSPERDATLRQWATVHRERFEARLVDLRRTPRRLERLLYLLHRGFDGSR